MARKTQQKVSKAEVSRVIRGGLQSRDTERAASIRALSRLRNSKAKIQARERNRLEAKYGRQGPRVAAAEAKLNANAEYISGLRMEANRAEAERVTCADNMWIAHGHVYDRKGQPVAGAKVTLHTADGERVEQVEAAESDTRGRYKLTYIAREISEATGEGENTEPEGSAEEATGKPAGAERESRQSRLSINADRQHAAFVRAVDATDDSVCADSTLMNPQLGKCNYRDLILDIVGGPGLVSDLDKDRRASRYLGNSSTHELHDLGNENAACQIDEIRSDHCVRFRTQKEAAELDYDFCAYCFGRKRSKR